MSSVVSGTVSVKIRLMVLDGKKSEAVALRLAIFGVSCSSGKLASSISSLNATRRLSLLFLLGIVELDDGIPCGFPLGIAGWFAGWVVTGVSSGVGRGSRPRFTLRALSKFPSAPPRQGMGGLESAGGVSGVPGVGVGVAPFVLRVVRRVPRAVRTAFFCSGVNACQSLYE